LQSTLARKLGPCTFEEQIALDSSHWPETADNPGYHPRHCPEFETPYESLQRNTSNHFRQQIWSPNLNSSLSNVDHVQNYLTSPPPYFYQLGNNRQNIDGFDFLTQVLANVSSAGVAYAAASAGRYLYHRRNRIYHTFSSLSRKLVRGWKQSPSRSSSDDTLRSRTIITVEGVDESWELVTISRALTADNISGENTNVADNEDHIGKRQARRNSL
jgi:hypothetical protein